jgi:hypothetical protein
VALVRPPVELPPAGAVVGAVALATIAALLVLVAGRVGPLWGAAIGCATVVSVALVDGGAWASLAHEDWPLLILAGAGFALCLRAPAPRGIALRVLALSLPLAVLYWVKNPGLARYVSQLVPELALVTAIGLATVQRGRLLVGTAAAALVAAGAVAASRPDVGKDAFQELVPVLERAPAGAIVTATPDAFGFLLSDRAVRGYRLGEQGLVLVDGAARALAPELAVEGTLLKRVQVINGFLRPDGTVDRDAVLLYRGRLVAAR